MQFETHKLEEPLSHYIESIFYYKGFNPDHSIERVVPTGHIFLIFELDGFTRSTFNSLTLKPNASYNKVWVSGMHKNYLSISAHKNSEMLVVQFKSAGAYPFLQLPLHQLNDSVVAGERLFGKDILNLRQQLVNNNPSLSKFRIISNWLIERMDHSVKIPSELVAMVEAFKNNSFQEHQELLKDYSKTQKNLISQFKKYVGLTPKVLHRIFRFNEVLNKIKGKQKLEWSQIAYQFHYADQSHFIKEFKEFSGLNPSQYIDSNFQNEEPNFFPLDKGG